MCDAFVFNSCMLHLVLVATVEGWSVCITEYGCHTHTVIFTPAFIMQLSALQLQHNHPSYKILLNIGAHDLWYSQIPRGMSRRFHGCLKAFAHERVGLCLRHDWALEQVFKWEDCAVWRLWQRELQPPSQTCLRLLVRLVWMTKSVHMSQRLHSLIFIKNIYYENVCSAFNTK
jgi:hypothetical protein